MTIIEASEIAGGSSGKSGGRLADWATPKCLAPLSFKVHGDLAKEHGGDELWGHRYVYCADVELEAQDSDTRRAQVHSTGTADRSKKFPSALDWILPDCLKSYKEIGNPCDTAQVNPYLYTTAMAKLAEGGGATIITARVSEINYSSDGRSIVSVTCSSKVRVTEVEATDILISAGPWTPEIFPRAVLLTPRGHSVVVKPSRHLSPHVLFPKIEPTPTEFKDLISPEIYPRPPDIAHHHDTVYSSGPDDYEIALPPSSESMQVDEHRCEDIWNALKSVSREIHDGKTIARQACYKPQIRRHEEGEEVGPMVGPTGIKGLWLATGHDEWGMQNSAGTGLVVSEMIFEGKAHSADCESLDPKYFLTAE